MKLAYALLSVCWSSQFAFAGVPAAPAAVLPDACVTTGDPRKQREAVVELVLDGVEPFYVNVEGPAKARVVWTDERLPTIEIVSRLMTVTGTGVLEHHLLKNFVTAYGILTLAEQTPPPRLAVSERRPR
jgi:hypothetical protein